MRGGIEAEARIARASDSSSSSVAIATTAAPRQIASSGSASGQFVEVALDEAGVDIAGAEIGVEQAR